MARNNTGNVFGFLALGVATVAGGAAIGYYVIGGAHPGPPAADARGIEQAPRAVGRPRRPPAAAGQAQADARFLGLRRPRCPAHPHR